MSREPQPRDRRYRSSLGAPVDVTAAVETPAEVYLNDTVTPPPVPGRSQPNPGPACSTTGAQSRAGKRFASTDELRSGVETGTTRGNNEPTPRASQEYGDSVRESRGVRTRPPRPGQHA